MSPKPEILIFGILNVRDFDIRDYVIRDFDFRDFDLAPVKLVCKPYLIINKNNKTLIA